MKQFLTVLKFELNNYFKNKSFLVTTVLIALLIAGIIIVPTLIPGLLDNINGGNKDAQTVQEEAEENAEQYGILAPEKIKESIPLFPAKWVDYTDEDAIKEAVEKDEIEAGFILRDNGEVTYVVNNLGMGDSNIMEQFRQCVLAYEKEQYLIEKGLTPEEIHQSENVSVTVTPEVLGKNSVNNFWYTYVLVFVVYFLILFYGQMISVSVTTEKSNRAIEILVTSVNSNSLIFGKVLAGALAGIIQTVIILGAGFAAYMAVGEAWGGILDRLFDIPSRVLISFSVFGILSYLLYAFIYGMLGALVSKTEDISKSATPVTLIYVVSFLIAMFGLNVSDSMLIKVASFIPFTSGNAMFIRISMGSVATWEILVSLILLAGTCVFTGILAAKIFRFGTLNYGNPIKITKAIKSIREK
ncbi:MAG: ABC transporter permease [Eubacteriales bacterium]|nr:ABC transporter permease [Eubacteriales bacterium]